MHDSLDAAIKSISDLKDTSSKVLKSLYDIKKLLFAGNVQKALKILATDNFAKALSHPIVGNILREVKQAIENESAKIRVTFDKSFRLECQRLGIENIQGNSMDSYRISALITVKIAFLKNTCEISTFAKSSVLTTLEPSKIADAVNGELQRLFKRSFDPTKFLNELHESYLFLKRGNVTIVPLREIFKLMWLRLQKDDFFEKSDSTKIKNYPADEFSVDLSKLIDSQVKKTRTGITYRLSLGSNGINIYGKDGTFNSYKFIEFIEDAKND